MFGSNQQYSNNWCPVWSLVGVTVAIQVFPLDRRLRTYDWLGTMTNPGELGLLNYWKTTTKGVLWLHRHLNSSSIYFCS